MTVVRRLKGFILLAYAQPGIFAVGSPSHCLLEFSRLPGISAAELVGALANLEEPHTTVGGTNLVVGVRPTLWAQLAPGQFPLGAMDFDSPVLGTEGFNMPATQRDVWVWVSGAAQDIVYDVCVDIIEALAAVAQVDSEVTGWSYRHSRDLTGFEDGTENPQLAEAQTVSLVPVGAPGEGSSIVLVQQWVHHADAWKQLSVDAQEKVIGRTKVDSIELAEDVIPDTSHVSRTVIEDESGEELRIFRRNVPYGTVTDHGTMFIGFTFDQHRMHRMLQRMAGAEDGLRDALTRYATPLTGSYYVVPSSDVLLSFASSDATSDVAD